MCWEGSTDSLANHDMPTVKALALLRLQMMRWQLKLYRELCNSFRFSWARLRNFKLTAVLSCRRHIQTPKPPAPALPHHQPAPLRILFCGSDHFSVPCLRALAEECSKNPRVIESIHVACRPPKRTGRGLQVMRERTSNVPVPSIFMPLLPKSLSSSELQSI